ncbi:alpha/beta-Hydrolases superfamily protein [Euphorbia peplus]|nr:alpha/beta-Hydrolases superfamily protein [Euphorbia peplus]
MLGHSKGGDVVLLYASKYHDISSVINVSGCYDLTKGIEERLGKGSWKRLSKMDSLMLRTKQVIFFYLFGCLSDVSVLSKAMDTCRLKD